MSQRVTIVGAGLAGALMANFLGQAGYRVRLLERRGDPRRKDVGGGRSINLAISTRGLDALDRVGLKQRVLDEAVPMRGRQLHAVDGSQSFQPYGTEDSQVINSVSRLGLNVLLIDACDELDNVTIEFDRRCHDVDLESGAVTVELPDETREVVESDFTIGADGAFSAVRARMQRLARFDYSQTYLEYGYKELTVPPELGQRLEQHALHIWPRESYMMIALPNQDGSFTGTLFWPFEGPDSFESVPDGKTALTFFERVFPDAIPLMPELVEEYDTNPTSPLVTVRCGPWHHGKTLLLGDACHAIVPFYGQGANAAFEDCTVLSQCLADHGLGPAAFEAYFKARKANADALAQLAIDNFVEMRDHVASPLFQWRIRFEKWLHRLMPIRYVPLYIMVTFTRIPYAEARRRADSQWNKVLRWGVSTLIAAGAGLAAVAWRLAR